MKGLKIFILTLMFSLVLGLASCGDDGLVVQVGAESQAFYQEKVDEYAKANNITHKITVKNANAGGAADSFLNDPSAGADIFTVPHDNLGKLVAGSGNIDPVYDQGLIDQIEDQNPESFLDAIYIAPGDGGQQNYYAVPYISQALVLFYDKTLGLDEDDVASFESLLAKAEELNKLAIAWTGTDGYNFSSFLLAQPKNQAAKDVFGRGTLKLYQNGQLGNCDCTGDDIVAIMKYAQRFINEEHGRNGVVTASGGYGPEINAHNVLGFISGAWNYNQAVAAWGEENVGVATLPSFTLTSEDAFGTAVAGMEFKSGSFVDCKCFVKKKNSQYKDELDSLLKYLTSNAVQKESYEKVKNLPASTAVDLGNADELTLAQVGMAEWGIPQPFGLNEDFNPAYYSKGTDGRFVTIVQNKATNNVKIFDDDAAIVTELQTITYVWTHINQPKDVATLNAWLASASCKCTNKTAAEKLNS